MQQPAAARSRKIAVGVSRRHRNGDPFGPSLRRAKDRLGRTVLHLAAQYGLTSLVKELIEPTSEGGFGADLFDVDLEGNMPIHIAIDFNRKGVFKVLLD